MTKATPNRTIDLTQGEPLGLLIRFALPLLLGGIFQQLYNMVDTMILGKFESAEALASVGAAASTFSFFLMASNAVTNGASILTAQDWGAKRMEELKTTVSHAMMIALAVSVSFGILAVTCAPLILGLLGTPENIVDGSVIYISITCGLLIAPMFYNASAAVLRAIGDSRTPLLFLMLCSILNILLDLTFVVVLGTGVMGVAIATVLSQSVSAVLCVLYMWKKYPQLRFGKEHLKVDWAKMKAFAGIIVPMFFQSISLSIGMMVITRVINSFGSDIVAAYTVGSKTEQLVALAFSQFAFSFSVYSGQNFGAKKYGRIDLGMKRAAAMVVSLVGVSMAVMFFFSRELALLFVDRSEPVIIENAVNMIRTECMFLPALGLIWLMNSCLRGMGFIKPTVISSFVELLSKIGLSILLSSLFGPIGIWYSAPIGWVLGLIPGTAYYFFSGWRKKAAKL